jgi:hypothetical protein
MTAGEWGYFSKFLPVPLDICCRLQMTACAFRRLQIFAIACRRLPIFAVAFK